MEQICYPSYSNRLRWLGHSELLKPLVLLPSSHTP